MKPMKIEPVPSNRYKLNRFLAKRLIRKLQKNDPKKYSQNEFDFYYNLPVEEKTVMVVGLGTNVRGNMQYVLDELNHSDRFEGYRIYVRTREDVTEEVVQEFIRSKGWKRTKTVPKGYTRRLEICQYLITESYFPYNYIKRPGQTLIDIWHGTPLKCLGVLKHGERVHKTSRQQQNFLYADYLLYPNEFTKKVMWDSYRITSLLHAKALMLGYPRNAGLLMVDEEQSQDLLQTLAPNGEKIYAYMPTFRGYLSDKKTIQKEKELLDYLDTQLRDDQILYVNLHHHVGKSLDFEGYHHIRPFPPLIDSYQLLTATDALISDYSSVFFDYLTLRKQIILHISDYDVYQQHQGLNMDIRDLPFDLADTKEEIIEYLNRGKQYDDTKYAEMMCAYDSPETPKKLCQLFAGDEEGLVLEEIPDTDHLKVLFYSEAFRHEKSTKLLDELEHNYAKARYEIYIGCDELKTEKNIQAAYPMLYDSLVIASRDELNFSSVGKPLFELYREGSVPFEKAMKFLAYEYALVTKRMYGETVFDTLAIYDTCNPDMIIGLSLSSAKHKLLFINDQMTEKMKDGDQYLKDAVCFAAAQCDRIAVMDPDSAGYIRSLSGINGSRVREISSTGQIRDLLDEMN